jgi:hypothetical protein
VGGVGDVPCKWSFFFFRIRTRLVFLLSLVLTSFTHSVGPGGGAFFLLHRFYWGFFILERGSDEVSSNTLRIVRGGVGFHGEPATLPCVRGFFGERERFSLMFIFCGLSGERVGFCRRFRRSARG